MDMNALMGTLLSGDAVSNMSQATGASAADVQNVLAAALPQLLTGAQAQANDAATAESFLGALAQHGKEDTSDVTAFLQNVDTKDGEKIVQHLLGSEQTAATQAAAQKAGLSVGNTAQILAMAAPLLMSLLGQQTQAAQPNVTTAGIGSLMGSLLGGSGGMDMSSLLTGLLGGASTAQSSAPAAGNLLGSLLGATTQAATTTTTSTGKKKKKPASSTSGKKPASSSKKDDSGDLLGGLGNLLGGLLK